MGHVHRNFRCYTDKRLPPCGTSRTHFDVARALRNRTTELTTLNTGTFLYVCIENEKHERISLSVDSSFGRGTFMGHFTVSVCHF